MLIGQDEVIPVGLNRILRDLVIAMIVALGWLILTFYTSVGRMYPMTVNSSYAVETHGYPLPYYFYWNLTFCAPNAFCIPSHGTLDLGAAFSDYIFWLLISFSTVVVIDMLWEALHEKAKSERVVPVPEEKLPLDTFRACYENEARQPNSFSSGLRSHQKVKTMH